MGAGLKILNFAVVCFILFKSRSLFFNPTLMMDEAYYIGATQAIAEGDLLLRSYTFDKPFLLAFWPLLGILCFGLSALGMKLIGTVCYIISFLIFQKALNRLEEKPLQNFLISASFYFLPLMNAHGISAMSEPYLMLAMSFFFWFVIENRQERKVFQAFIVGFMTKYTMLLWFPVVLFPWIRQKVVKSKLRVLLSVATGWLLVWLLFNLTNPAKFASVAWFSQLGTNPEASTSLWSRVEFWIPTIWSSLLGYQGGGFVLLLLLATFIRRALKQRDERFYQFWLPTFLQFGVIMFSGVRSFDRYLVTLIPGLALCTALMINDLPKQKIFVRSGLAFLMIYLFQVLSAPRVGLGGEGPELGRQLMVINQEYNRVGTILQTDFVWQSWPYAKKMIVSGCTTDSCAQTYRVGLKQQHDQFLLKKSDVAPGFTFERLHYDQKPAVTEKVVFERMAVLRRIVGWLRLSRAATIDQFEIRPDETFRLVGTLKSYPFEVEGKFFVNDWSDFPHEINQKRLTLVAQVNQFKIDDHDLLDVVMPLFYGGYTLRLGPIGTKSAQLPHEVSLSFKD